LLLLGSHLPIFQKPTTLDWTEFLALAFEYQDDKTEKGIMYHPAPALMQNQRTVTRPDVPSQEPIDPEGRRSAR
jgi:hypothetical protein